MRTAFALLTVLVLVGCSDSTSNDAPDVLADIEQLDASIEPEVGVDVGTGLEDVAVDATTDTKSDAEEWLPVPIEPARPDPSVALVDRSYMQEFNHTINEVPEGTTGIKALVMPPEGYDDFARPTFVATNGLWLPSDEDGLRLLSTPADTGEVVDAAVAHEKIWLLTSTHLLEVIDADTIATHEAHGATALSLAASDENLWLLTDSALGKIAADGAITWDDAGPAPTALAPLLGRMVYAAPGSLRAVEADGTVAWESDLDVGTPVAVIPRVQLPQPIDFVIVGTEGLAGFTMREDSAEPMDVPLFAADRIPLSGAVRAIPDSNGGFIVAANGGAYRLIESDIGVEYRVYVPERWMPSGQVNDILEDTELANGPLYFATEGGVGWMTRQEWSIADKIDAMIERIELRHDREGSLSDSRLTAPGDLSTSIPYDSDNDGGWTCYWVLSECFRYKLTGDEQAKANFDKSLARMLSFRTLTGTDYFLARSVIRIDGCQLDDCDGPDDGEWFLSPDGEWWVKADTSNDEVTSHMFMMGHAYDLCADEQQKEAIAAHVDGIVGGIVENGYQLVDPQDGECTSYGQFDPFYVNLWAGVFSDGGRRAAQMLGAINLAYYLTGDPKYLEAKQELIEEHHYDENVANVGNANIYGFCAGSGDCDELAFQAFVPLLRYEPDPELREMWMAGWRQHYAHLGSQEDAFWDIADAVFEGGPYDAFYSQRWYERYPTDLVRWRIHNDGFRTDVQPPPPYYEIQESKPNYKLRSDGHIVPSDERPNHRHNGPQFQFSGGWGSLRELDGGDALFPYWYGRYYGFVANPD